MSRLASFLIAFALAACGEDRFAAERERVKKMVPGADEIRCSGEPREAVDCRAGVKGKPFSCEFRYEESDDGRAFTGSHACWPERR